MPRDYRSASKSMMDLSGRTNDDDDDQDPLHRARSVWDVGHRHAVPRRRKVNSFSPSDQEIESLSRPRSLPATSHPATSLQERHQRTKRTSSIQWAAGVGRDDAGKVTTGETLTASRAGTPHRLSSSSTTSNPVTPSSSGDGLDPEVFRSDVNITEAQSMMSLSRPYRTSNCSDDEPRAFRKKPSSALHALKNLSRSTPAMSPSVSPRHSDSEGPPRVSKGTKKFMRHFADAPPNEWVLNYFSCALVADILLQGTLFITPNFFAFYSKIFGHVSRLLIPVTQVEAIQKERTAKIIPNAVGLHMVDGKTYVFGSLLSRDSTYKLMLHIWKKAQRMADSDSEPPLSVVQVAGEEEDDEVEDSVSGSAESEDHSDVAYVVTNPIPVLIGVPTLISTTAISSPWTRDSTITTTTANIVSSILPIQDIRIPSTTNSSSIPVNSLVGSPSSAAARQGSFSGAKSGSIVEEPRIDADAGLLQWVTQGSLVKTCFRMGRVPVKLVGEGIKELWALPRTSLLLIISTLLLLMLFASAAFMLHRVDILSQQLGLEKYDDYDGMYEEVLQMQQRLHAAASTEIEKTLSIQLKHIATVRQSLEALVVLFNKEPPMNTAQIPDNT